MYVYIYIYIYIYVKRERERFMLMSTQGDEDLGAEVIEEEEAGSLI